MKDIDFLPSEFRQQHSQQHERIWRVVVVAGFLAMLVAASLVQVYRLRWAQGCLAQYSEQRAAAKNQDTQIARLQSQLKDVNADAELFTYLCHPWLRTQILAALLAPLPDSVTLDQLEIRIDLPPGLQRRQTWQRREETQTGEKASALPADRDLAMLREQLDRARVLAVLSGNTTDSATLHRYLSTLDHCSLFDQVELDSITSLEETGKDVPEGAISFKAIVTVCPAYGQPKGPTGSVQIAHRTSTTTRRDGQPGRSPAEAVQRPKGPAGGESP